METIQFRSECKLCSRTVIVCFLSTCERIPTMKVLPKTHEPEIPLRPITSRIGSAPHRLAKRLAKPLSSSLGKISEVHLKNSSDLINKLQSIDFKDKILASFDIQSLYTNVLIQNAISAIKKVLPHINGDDLPINKKDYVKLIEMCFKCASVSFDGKTFHQHEGLPMGSPISAVAARLFIETLEKEEYMNIIPNDSKWYRYMDDCLLVLHKDTNISDILSRLNQVHPIIQLTVNHKVNGSLPFLDAVIIRENSPHKQSKRLSPSTLAIVYQTSQREMKTTLVVPALVSICCA
ncbi:uncharacterized protein LOC143028723 [Oratosquilla oratoria]|uniref:uncharacterized protein LOC143028723 n=1 Tax=Oratosquilla oratoria TaxID=337810 RepID=UPI003F75A4F8